MAQLTDSAYGAPPELAMSEDLPLREDRRTTMKQGRAELPGLPEAAGVPRAIELRHLRYFTAVANAGSFTHAAEQMFIAQPTLSQQIRRLEEIIGTPLLQRRRDGVRLTKAGTVLLEASRTVLSLVDHEVNRTRQAAGLGRPRLRVVVPPGLPDALAVEAASALRSAAAAADVEISWLEAPLDAEFSPIRQRRADAGLGWLTASPEALPAPLDVMSFGDFEPDVWVPSRHPAARRATISLDELARMDVIHGPRRLEPGIYDAWTRVLRTVNPRFEFTDPPLRHSLPMALAFAATADRPTAVLTGPGVIAGSWPGLIRMPRARVSQDMVLVGLEHHQLTATAAVVWNGDLPRPLQQVLFDAADGITPPAPARTDEHQRAAIGLAAAPRVVPITKFAQEPENSAVMTSLNTLTGETADRLAIRGLVDAWAHCADRRKPQQQAELFVPDGTVTVYRATPPPANQSGNSAATPNSPKPLRFSTTTTRPRTLTGRAPSPLTGPRYRRNLLPRALPVG